jgi:hypothetical protein
MSAPSRAELINGLRRATALIYRHGSNLKADGEDRLPYLKMAHRIERLLLRDGSSGTYVGPPLERLFLLSEDAPKHPL